MNRRLESLLRSYARILHLRRPQPLLSVWARTLLYRSVYTKKSLAAIPDVARVRVPESCLYFNALGRFLFALQQRFYLFCGSKKKLAIKLEHFDELDYGRLYQKGNQERLWPVSPFVEKVKNGNAANDELIERLQASYVLAYAHDTRQLPHSPWWKGMTAEFQEHFFDGHKAIKRDVLEDFRRRATSKAAIVGDQVDMVVPQRPFGYSYKKSLKLVLQYHRRSEWVDHAILGSVSESFSGNNLCPVYRGQRLSGRLLRHAYYISQIRKHTDFKKVDSFSIMDLGGAYGGLVRLLSLYYTNCRAFLVELPEVCVLAGYLLSEALPHKRITVLSDLSPDDLLAGQIDFSESDIYILPTWAIEYLPDRSIDLVINTQSLGEMSRESGHYYMRHIERLARDYFYSCNRPFSDISKYDDFGFYNWEFRERWHTILSQLNHVGMMEWLGRSDNQGNR